MSSLHVIPDVKVRGMIKHHKWKCPIPGQFHEGYVIYVGNSGIVKSIDNESTENELYLL